MDLPLNQRRGEPPRINNLTPDDFKEGGRFFNIQLPLYPPIPSEILNFVFGEDRDQLQGLAKMRFLEELHAFRGVHIRYCGCGDHILNKQPVQILNRAPVIDEKAELPNRFDDSDTMTLFPGPSQPEFD